MARAALLLLLVGCKAVQVSAQPADLGRHADELRAQGYARVPSAEGGEITVNAADHVTVTIPGNEERHLWGLVTTGRPDENQRLTIGDLVAGCGAAADQSAGCLADHVLGPIPVGTRQVFDGARVGIGVFGLAATVVSITCLAVCHDPSGWAYVGAGLGVVTLLVPVASTSF